MKRRTHRRQLGANSSTTVWTRAQTSDRRSPSSGRALPWRYPQRRVAQRILAILLAFAPVGQIAGRHGGCASPMKPSSSRSPLIVSTVTAEASGCRVQGGCAACDCVGFVRFAQAGLPCTNHFSATTVALLWGSSTQQRLEPMATSFARDPNAGPIRSLRRAQINRSSKLSRDRDIVQPSWRPVHRRSKLRDKGVAAPPVANASESDPARRPYLHIIKKQHWLQGDMPHGPPILSRMVMFRPDAYQQRVTSGRKPVIVPHEGEGLRPNAPDVAVGLEIRRFRRCSS